MLTKGSIAVVHLLTANSEAESNNPNKTKRTKMKPYNKFLFNIVCSVCTRKDLPWVCSNRKNKMVRSNSILSYSLENHSPTHPDYNLQARLRTTDLILTLKGIAKHLASNAVLLIRLLMHRCRIVLIRTPRHTLRDLQIRKYPLFFVTWKNKFAENLTLTHSDIDNINFKMNRYKLLKT